MSPRRLAHYEVLGLLGRGGMGEVHRARDTRLDREVAIKLLPGELLRDAERVARFQREARTLASLNHPQIAGLYGVEEAEGQRFLVMELAEGEDLSHRIAAGPLPLDDALDVARQIALGLEEAHAKNIVHRDLKPANIKLSSDGAVKILDFGLARAFQGETVDEDDLGNSPTITAAMTQQGVVLGTAAYMSPEQAKGKTVDRRADVWSFGVILWEMLTGKRLFTEETTSEVLAAVLRADIPWDELPDDLPLGVRRLLERCLERDPRSRLQDIGEARIRLERWEGDPTTLHESFVGAAADDDRPRWRTALPWSLVAIALAVAAWGWFSPRASTETSGIPLAFEIDLSGGKDVPSSGTAEGRVWISPRGDLLAFESGGSIWLREFDDLEARQVDGSEGAQGFTFSPDGRWIAFAARGSLFRASIRGGASTEICEAIDPRGMTWVDEDTIVLSTGFTTGLSAVSVATGAIRTITTPDPERGERSHRWPYALPDGKSVLMVCQFLGRDYDESDIQIVSVATGERKTLHEGGSYPVYTTSGHLLFARGFTIFAVEVDLDAGTTRGLPVPVLDDVDTQVGDQEIDNGVARFDVSPQGMVVYRTSGVGLERTRIAAFDLESGQVDDFGAVGHHARLTLSPDGAWLAVARLEDGASEIYLYDLSTRTEQRFTRQRGLDAPGCWSPDSRTLYWTHSSGDGNYWVLRQPIDGSAPIDTLAGHGANIIPTSVSADGRWLLLTIWRGGDAFDVDILDLEAGTRQTEALAGGPGSQAWGHFSPDQNWVVFVDNGSGQSQYFIERFPDTGAVWQVTQESQRIDGAAYWARDGRSLVMRRKGTLLKVPLELDGGAVRIGTLRTTPVQGLLWIAAERDYGVGPDATVVYGLHGEDGMSVQGSRYVLRTRWFDELRERVADGL